MATSQNTIDFLLDQLTSDSHATTRKMFGEYCLYVAGKPVGFICDDQLFLKPTPAGRNMLPTVTEGYPYPGAKLYLLITADLWEDSEWLNQLIQATADALPLPKPKKKTPVI
jgi:DNA transformation protein